jgi:molybdopterin synthase catalytic subunit
MITITREDFSVDKVLNQIRSNKIGAIVTFIGVVRDNSKGRAIEFIEIQVYEEMAKRQLESIRQEAIKRFGIEEIVIIHRYGSLDVSNNIMMIAVGAAHRMEAFKACSWVLESIKEKVPIWKKEITTEGDFWVEGEIE